MTRITWIVMLLGIAILSTAACQSSQTEDLCSTDSEKDPIQILSQERAGPYDLRGDGDQKIIFWTLDIQNTGECTYSIQADVYSVTGDLPRHTKQTFSRVTGSDVMQITLARESWNLNLRPEETASFSLEVTTNPTTPNPEELLENATFFIVHRPPRS